MKYAICVRDSSGALFITGFLPGIKKRERIARPRFNSRFFEELKRGHALIKLYSIANRNLLNNLTTNCAN